MRQPKEREPVRWRQLCAITREVILAEPTMDDAEWKARIKDRLIVLELDYPSALDMIQSAMSAIEHALTQTLGPRPPPTPLTVSSAVTTGTKPQQDDPPWKRFGRSSPGWASIADLMANLQGFASSAPSFDALPEVRAHEMLAITEGQALSVYYRDIARPDADRIAVLRMFAEVAIHRPAEWDPQRVRADATRHHLHADVCFGCCSGDRPIAWHHILQVQHGGSNTPRNRMALCDACHAAVHPWLAATPRRRKGWTGVGDMAASAAGTAKPPTPGFLPMRTWSTAVRNLTCGYDAQHVIRKGDVYLGIDIGGTRKRVRCQICALAQYGERAPGVEAPSTSTEEPLAPVEEPS